ESHLKSLSAVNKLTPVKKEENSLEDSSVTLSYRYSKQATGGDEFYWYRQYPGKPPEFIIFHLGTGTTMKSPIPGLTIEVKDKIIHMNISSAEVKDSAVYYCALRPTVTGNTKTLYKNLWNKHTTTQPSSETSTKGLLSLHCCLSRPWACRTCVWFSSCSTSQREDHFIQLVLISQLTLTRKGNVLIWRSPQLNFQTLLCTTVLCSPQ
uniref:Immunoglobulin V-set domain-containing protein n=1 Tax=Sander lucioperca TaxID=283035 RepID=A0A8C9XCZ8_SANLU